MVLPNGTDFVENHDPTLPPSDSNTYMPDNNWPTPN